MRQLCIVQWCTYLLTYLKFLLFLQILSEFNSEKNYENWSTFAEVIIKIKVARIFLRHGVYIHYTIT